MAKKKTKNTPKRRTKRRIGATGGTSGIMELVGVAGGFVVGNILSARLLPNLDPKIKGAVKIGLGTFLLPRFSKMPILKSMGTGLSVSGAYELLQGTGLVAGIGRAYTPAIMPGSGVNQLISGTGVSSMVSGRKMNLREAALYSN